MCHVVRYRENIESQNITTAAHYRISVEVLLISSSVVICRYVTHFD